MMDLPQDNPEKQQGISSAAFARFLEALSSDPEEACLRYNCLNKKLISFFNMKGVSDPESAAAETLDRAAVIIFGGKAVLDVEKYCRGIAHNIAKERWRRDQRESSIFSHFIESLANNSDEEVERIERLLKPCFEQLAAEEKELLLAYCQAPQGRARAESRRQLAETLKTTVLALRMRVTRLRSVLSECIEKAQATV